ncbi:hypothetical protein LTR37_018572 [Vermiconidia calcicola]|uniref:Uncharacterized protein n=1 Tax=Vermiconidia calcicola TaxID=1690605 RepID=A0ACC3MHS6_9PEZI|nr:hypothetical protein LTR37_018572 [Vermiconidia calcicola]
MLDPLSALGVAGNLIQLIDFGFKLVSEGKEIYESTSGALEDNKVAETLANDLAKLTTGVTESQTKWLAAHAETQLDPDEIQLRNLCDRCTEIAVELNIHLQKLKVDERAKHRKLKSVKQAIISVWKKEKVEAIANRLEKYQSEVDTQVLFGLRKSAQAADVKNSAQFEALDQQTKELTITVLDGGKKLDARLSNQDEILARIHDTLLTTMQTVQKRSPSPAPAYETVAGSCSSAATALHEAAGRGDPQDVRVLLRSPTIDVNSRDGDGCTPLHLASSGEVAKRLLNDKRIDKNLEDYSGYTALHCAVLKCRLDVIKALLEAGIDKTLEDDQGKAAAFYAIGCPAAWWLLKYGHETEAKAEDHLNNTGLLHMSWLGDEEGVQFFLRHKADVNAINKWHETALTEASRHGNSSIVKILIDHKAHLELAAGKEWTPLLQAVRDDRIETVRTLLERGADKEAKLNNDKTPLVEACTRSHFRVAELLVFFGAAIEVADTSKRTPLLLAAHKGKKALTSMLLDRGANIEARDKDGCNAAYCAAKGGHVGTLNILLDHGLVVNAKTDQGFTAISIASNLGHYECVKLLLRRQADPNIHGARGSGYTALAEASHHGRVEVVTLLLEQGAKWDIGSKSGYSALSVAAYNGQDAVIRILFDHGADIEQPGYASKDPELSVTPLMRAAMAGKARSVALLTELGAKVDMRDVLGRTALFLAADRKHDDCVRILLERGANVNIQTEKGETALMKAAYHGRREITQMLVESNANLQLRDWRQCTAWIFAVQTDNNRLEHLLRPSSDEDETLHTLRAERHPNEIAAYLTKCYQNADKVYSSISFSDVTERPAGYWRPFCKALNPTM